MGKGTSSWRAGSESVNSCPGCSNPAARAPTDDGDDDYDYDDDDDAAAGRVGRLPPLVGRPAAAIS
ncbi:hypothetical protein I552_0584 [Mycobacterium xenopi 3993]|nr:hypothetical protein I552_0584 [Mycobacterium xenopi 3993]